MATGPPPASTRRQKLSSAVRPQQQQGGEGLEPPALQPTLASHALDESLDRADRAFEIAVSQLKLQLSKGSEEEVVNKHVSSRDNKGGSSHQAPRTSDESWAAREHGARNATRARTVKPPPPAPHTANEDEFSNIKEWQAPTATQRHLPAAAQLIDFAQQLGIDGMADAELLWIAEDAWLEPMPDGWEELETHDKSNCDQEGEVFYHRVADGHVQWTHPLSSYYHGLVFMKRQGEKLAAEALRSEPPDEEEVAEMAAYAQVDLSTEASLRETVLQMVAAPLPPGWEEVEGGVFVHAVSGVEQEAHPLDEYFLQAIARARRGAKRQGGCNSAEAVRTVGTLLELDGDPHAALGLSRGAGAAAVRRRYRELALLVHPDKCEHARAAEAFAVLTRCYKAILFE